MRIHRIHLQHVAGVDDRELVFGDGVTVVVGPNEAGKSTIPTALKLLLEEKDRYDNADIRAIRPVHVDEDPTIELECTTGPYRLTYRKCFGSTPRRRETSLTVHSPRPESLTGDAAHDRMAEILDETVDEQLWSALRVQQRHDVGQADLTGSRSLAAALEAAGTGSAALTDDGSLLTRVDEAAAEFWTDTGRPRKPLTMADVAVEEATTSLDVARAELAEVQGAVARHDRLVDQLLTWRRDLPGLELRAKETAEAVAEVQVHRDALAAAERAVAEAEDDAVRARDRVTDREVLVTQVHDHATVLEDRRADAVAAADAVARADARVAEAREARDEARSELATARAALRAAEADVRLLRLDTDRAELLARIEDAEALHAQREQAKARLDDRAPGAGDIRRLEQLEADVRTAAAVLEADLPRVRVAGPAGTDVRLGDETLALADEAVDRAVDGELSVRIGEVTVTVSPGSSATELADAHADAAHALRSALAQWDVQDVAAARARRDAAREASAALQQTEAAWARVIALDGLDGLRSSLARTEQQAAQLRGDRPEDRPLPDDVAAGERRVAACQDDVTDAETVLASAEAGLEGATGAATAARTASAEATARAEAATERADELAASLERARATVTDDQLAEDAVAAGVAVTDARATRDAAAAALSGLDISSVEADHDAATARRDAIRQQITAADLERATVWGNIEASAASGLGERVPQLEAALEDAEARREALRHRADALLLLRDTLHRHRDAARSRYLAPLQAEVERLGRVVFGDDFSVELDESLRVVKRTLHGRTLELDQLSGGAQEQLAIITRLAAATLVDPDDGVPLILDDALGYADPTRTDRVNTLLATVGADSQVIVLTCDPDRFAGVRDATLVSIG